MNKSLAAVAFMTCVILSTFGVLHVLGAPEADATGMPIYDLRLPRCGCCTPLQNKK